MFNAASRGTVGTPVGMEVRHTPSTSSRFEAGSVLTNKTRRPASASAMAEAHAREVLPTPPLPVKNRNRVGDSKKRARDCSVGMLIWIQHEPPRQQCAFSGAGVAATFIPNYEANSPRSG